MQFAPKPRPIPPEEFPRIEKEMRRQVSNFRGELFSEHPSWSILSARLETIIVPDGTYQGRAVPTAMTNGSAIVFNAAWYAWIPYRQRKATFLHEVCHNSLGHSFRKGNRKQKSWNWACDQEVNLILQSLGYHIDGWLCDERFRGMSAERIYGIRESEIATNPPPEPPPERGERGDEPVDSRPPEIEEQPEEPEEGSAGKPKEGGLPETTEPESNPYQDPGEVWDAVSPDGNPLDDQAIAEKLGELSRDIQMAEMAGKQCGTGANPTMKRSLDRITKPRMNWRNRLDKWTRSKGKPNGRTLSSLDRRSLQRGTFNPGEIKEGMDWLAVFVDISGSINFPDFKAFMSHLDKIRESVKVKRMTIVPFNSTIQHAKIVELKPGDPTPKKLDTGGGTRFACIFNWLRRQPRQPDGVMVFTDLCCTDYGEPTNAPVIWISTDEVYTSMDGWYTNVPPFGEVVQIDHSD